MSIGHACPLTTLHFDAAYAAGTEFGRPLFEDCRVPAANLIGPHEGRGLQPVPNGLELGRINVAANGQLAYPEDDLSACA
jgi:alkylation response protein AidB-like acyl-CoA dehydrogenase